MYFFNFIFMVVYIYRRHFTRWGIEGTLVIKGTKVCDTLEHPICYFPAGEYEITLFSPILAGEKSRKMPIVLIPGMSIWNVIPRIAYIQPGNGPMRLKYRSIILGESVLPGLVIHTQECFERFYERLRKAIKRNEYIYLNIVDLGSDEIPISD